MPENYYAVIGANFGDEGKGLFVDYLAHKHKDQEVFVVRYNGGAQAGHTVQTPEGQRHVFSHFSAGSFAGARTVLASEFVCNPILFRRERIELLKKGVLVRHPFVHPSCRVTTPFDMIYNQEQESVRQKTGTHHGSVGVGFNATIQRHAHYSLRIDHDMTTFKLHMKEIKTWYERNRLYSKLEEPFLTFWNDPKLIPQFLEDLEYMKECIVLKQTDNYAKCDTMIFEGAQGLLLSNDYSSYYPYLTNSKTGTDNIYTILHSMGDANAHVTTYHATRPYLTRHGRGPMPREMAAGSLPTPKYSDATNVPNKFQESVRFAPLDITSLQRRIDGRKINGPGRVAISCLDHIEKEIPVYVHNECRMYTKKKLDSYLRRYVSPNLLTSNGPTREYVREE